MRCVKIVFDFNAVRDHAPTQQGITLRLLQTMGPTRTADFMLTHLDGSVVGSVAMPNFDVGTVLDELSLRQLQQRV